MLAALEQILIGLLLMVVCKVSGVCTFLDFWLIWIIYSYQEMFVKISKEIF